MTLNFFGRALTVTCLLALLLFGVRAPASAQGFAGDGVIERIAVVGNERVEPATVASYLTVTVGDPFDPEQLDASLKALFATGLFADVAFQRQANALIIQVVENPIINRIIFEGNDRLDNEELGEEIQLRPRIVFTRSKARQDVQRMLDLYRRNGRFGAIVEPKIIQLPQNRVDLIFEISEGPKTKVRKINFLGNRKFSDSNLRAEIATVQARFFRFFSSNDTYDPDRLAFDRQLLRRFYLTQGYADFRVVSAVAELTPNREEFFITFTVEEGEIYDFGEVELESEIRDIDAGLFKAFLRVRANTRYNAINIEDSIEALSNAAGVLGYAFVDVRPRIRRDRENRVVNVTFVIQQAPRVYVERIDINGNSRTLDRVIRREFRLIEGDAFNSALVARSEDRINRLNYFREVEVEQVPGNADDRLILNVGVQEQPTGSLNIGAGFSSLDNFIFDLTIQQANLLGRGQNLRLGFRISSRRNEVDLGFTEPYLFGRPVAGGVDLFRRQIDNNDFGFFELESIGFALRAGLALAEFTALRLRYSFREDDLNVDEEEVAPIIASLEAASGGVPLSTEFLEASSLIDNAVLQSQIGYTISFDTRNSVIRPTRGQSIVFSQDFAGLGGDVRFLRQRLNYDQYFPLPFGFVFRLAGEGGFITSLGDDLRLQDRFFLGGPRLRGFNVAGVGPRDINGNAVGGDALYIGKAELFLPLGDTARELGVQASFFADTGSLLDIDANNGFAPGTLLVDNGPRLALGFGISWQSPFGPFRIDISEAVLRAPFDVTEQFQFNIGTRF